VQRILDQITAPAYVRNGRLDILSANQLGTALYSRVFDDPIRPANTARFIFLNPRAPEFFADWESIASDAVGILRAEAGRDPYDRVLSDLIGELSTRSEEFRVRWAAHNVKFHRTGTKRLHHLSLGTSYSPTRRSSFRPMPARGCSSTPRSRAPPLRRPCTSSPVGPRRPTDFPSRQTKKLQMGTFPQGLGSGCGSRTEPGERSWSHRGGPAVRVAVCSMAA
jgi:hypothetical protein